ncbi:MAG: energy transducer TonB [Gammaproteobacteria bacterium]
MSQQSQGPASGRQSKGFGRSAESIVAIALLGVCVAAGAAWLLSSEGTKKPTAVASAAQATASADASMSVDEQAALEAWRRGLRTDFATPTPPPTPRPTPVRTEPPPPTPTPVIVAIAPTPTPQQLAFAAVPTPRPTPTPEPVLEPASLDWSTCDPPRYPPASVRWNEEGTVVMSFDVDSRGRVIGGRVAETSGTARLDEAALNALRKCRFKPATRDGVAEASVALVRFVWKLDGD